MKKNLYGVAEASGLSEWQSTDSQWLLKDLEEICKSDQFNIDLKDENGKKKLKLMLYNEINLKYIKYI